MDIGLTHIPLEARSTSLEHINLNLRNLEASIERVVPGTHVVYRADVWKLRYTYSDTTVRIGVNGIKRGIFREMEVVNLCPKARGGFQANYKARIIPYPQLYGGKVAAVLNHQHPCDLFDCKYMEDETLDKVEGGLFLCLLRNNKPVMESLCPGSTNQEEALKRQSGGITDIPSAYRDYGSSHNDIIREVNTCLTNKDENFIISFEESPPQWELCCTGDLNKYPSVQWKLLNIEKLKEQNQEEFQEGVDKLKTFFGKVIWV